MTDEKGKTGKGPLSRREFVTTSALLGTGALAASQFPWLIESFGNNGRREIKPTAEYTLAKPENIIYSVCQQCNTQCGIKVKLRDGVAVKIDGSAYSPWTMHPHVPYESSPLDLGLVDGFICPKGQAGIQTAYDPYRVVRVLKRDGPRGSNRWTSVPFDKAIDEIVNGGDLFGEGHVDGLKDIWALRDPDVAKEMEKDVKKILDEKDKDAKKQLVEEFKAHHADHLDVLIDPDHPDLGPKNNQLAFVWGRLKDGRGDFIKRFASDAFASINAHGHTTVCQGSLYFAGKAMSEQFDFDEKDKKAKWTGGDKFFWQADQESAEFVIFVGVNPFEASQGPPLRAHRITEGLSSGRLRYVVIDPRLSRTAAKAWKWLPAKPGTEAAVALALIRWVLDNERYDATYLSNANMAAAAADGEPTWSNAAWLVKIEEGKPTEFLRGSDLGLEPYQKTATVKDEEVPYELDPFIVLSGGQPVPLDPNDEENPIEGDLLVDTTIDGVSVKSALQILKDEASSRTIEEWAEIADVKASDLEEIAAEFTSHGKRATADIHRGVSQHTNGLYNCSTWLSLNLLIGNYDWKGGMSKGSKFDAAGGKEGQPYPLKDLHPGKGKAFGINIIRAGDKYDKSTIYEDYPAKRQWYPLATDIYQEIAPSAGDAYPYPIKALILYMGTPVYSNPAGHTNIEILADPTKIPLFICSDIVIGETSMYADYIFPDLTYLERWEFSSTHFSVVWKVQGVRQPAIASPNETVTAFGEEMPLSVEALMLGLAERLGLPGFGPAGFGDEGDFNRPEDLYMKMIANVAFGHEADGSDAVPEADDAEMELFAGSRRHLPPHVFDAERWERAVKPELWRKVVYVLNRGGRFADFEKAYDGDLLKNQYAKQINLYQEKTYSTKSAITGEHYKGYPNYTPAPLDLADKPVEDADFDLTLLTHREITHTKSRTIADYWLLGINPEGVFIINRLDAERLDIKDGDRVKVVSASNPNGEWDLKNGDRVPMVGEIKVIEGIRPGVISYSLGMGHWAYGARDVEIDGKTIKGDERRAKGIHANAALHTDPNVSGMSLTDPVGGSAVFYDTKVRLVKV
jgi:tetrathionate reductase subunit A